MPELTFLFCLDPRVSLAMFIWRLLELVAMHPTISHVDIEGAAHA